MKNAPNFYRMKQGSDEWKSRHIGKPTASNFFRILQPKKGELSKMRRGYMCRLVAERLLNEFLPERVPDYDGELYWANRGTEMEPVAIQAFEKFKQVKFDPIGFVTTPGDELGCSPDGLVRGTNDREAIEIKCPAPWHQMNYLLTEEEEDPKGAVAKYKSQVQGQMLIGQFECVHLFVYHPRMPPKYVCTLPDPPYQEKLRQALWEFIGEVNAATEKAREIGPYVRFEEIMNVVE